MVSFLSVLFWLIVGLVAILIAVIVTPVRLRTYLRTSPQLIYRVDARVFGGLSPRLPILDSSRPSKVKTKKKAKKQEKKKASRGRKNRVFGRTNIVSELPRLFSGVIGSFQFEHLNLKVEFGLHDPADTGQLFGFLTPLQYSGCMVRNVSISLRPNFEQACFAGEVDASVRFTAISLLFPIVRFAWNVFGAKR